MSEPETQHLAPVYLTFHAVDRFRERSRRALGVRYTPAAARTRIAGLLARAEPDDPDDAVRRRLLAYRTRRTVEQGGKVEYWRVGGWRFVVVMDPPAWKRVLVTCERVVPGEN